METFLARQRERDRNVPGFVESEFHSFLDCGVLAVTSVLFNYIPDIFFGHLSFRLNRSVEFHEELGFTLLEKFIQLVRYEPMSERVRMTIKSG